MAASRQTNLPPKVRRPQPEAVPGAEDGVKMWSQARSLVPEKKAVGRSHGPSRGSSREQRLGV